jgi:branched-chain amino acid transport system ATP-binding protein
VNPQVATPILRATGVHLSFGGVAALSGVDFFVNDGEVLSIIGPNGAGKTSLLNAISGVFRISQGEIAFEGRQLTRARAEDLARAGIARTFQNLALFKGMTVEENVLVGRHALMKSGVLACGTWWGKASREEATHRAKVAEILEFLGLSKLRHAQADTLAYGLRKRVELGRAMAVEPRLLLLDEPTAGMSHAEKSEFMAYVLDLNRTRKITIVLIEHDMGVVMKMSDRIVVLDHGVKIAEGAPDKIVENRDVIHAYLGEQ